MPAPFHDAVADIEPDHRNRRRTARRRNPIGRRPTGPTHVLSVFCKLARPLHNCVCVMFRMIKMPWHDVRWHDSDDDDDQVSSWRRRKQLFVAEATSVVTEQRPSRQASSADGGQTARPRPKPTPVRPRPPQRSIALPQSRVTWPLDRRRGQCSDRPATKFETEKRVCFFCLVLNAPSQ